MSVLRSELYRTATLRSSWVSMGGTAFLGGAFAFFSEDFWSLFAGLGGFGIALITTAQHYQHRTAFLLFLGQPRRLRVLAAQCIAAAIVATVLTAVTGVVILSSGDATRQYLSTLIATPLIAIFGVACATVVRKPMWLLIGWLCWVLFAEGMIGRLESPLPLTVFLAACVGDIKALLLFAAYTAGALVLAVWSIRRDLNT